MRGDGEAATKATDSTRYATFPLPLCGAGGAKPATAEIGERLGAGKERLGRTDRRPDREGAFVWRGAGA